MDYREAIYTKQWRINTNWSTTEKKKRNRKGAACIFSVLSRKVGLHLLWVVEKEVATRGLGVPVCKRIERELNLQTQSGPFLRPSSTWFHFIFLFLRQAWFAIKEIYCIFQWFGTKPYETSHKCSSVTVYTQLKYCIYYRHILIDSTTRQTNKFPKTTRSLNPHINTCTYYTHWSIDNRTTPVKKRYYTAPTVFMLWSL